MKKFLKFVILLLFVLLVGVFFYFFSPGLWNHFIVYPKLEKEIAALQAKRVTPARLTQLTPFRGLMHSHCYWSHDSRGTLQEILSAAKKADIDFIYFTDHERAVLDTFPRALDGYYDGVLMVSGTENNDLLLWPLADTVIDWRTDNPSLIKGVINAGGLVVFPHCEEKRPWLNPDYQGMEIYNIHTDIKDESYSDILFNTIVNQDRYRHWIYRELFDEQTTILARWDSLNTWRRIVGFSAVDAHENQNIRASYLPDGRVEWLGPNANPIDSTEVGLLEKILLSEPDENGWAFKLYLDTFYHSFRFVNNHIFADSLEKRNIANHFLQGHLYVGFDALADAEGFLFYALNEDDDMSGILGDEIELGKVKKLAAVSPLPGRYRLLRNGIIVDEKVGEYDYRYDNIDGAGVYRLEVALALDDQWIPWIYTNPIYVK
ncbi:MAG: hypothetical protein H6696_10060 [Deferribacteres bacterium]|nr:hypothetical protein [candidate division KSB1 bacterium]MCB9502272.1 hypothetical protein [Deferribacteres bacterium]